MTDNGKGTPFIDFFHVELFHWLLLLDRQSKGGQGPPEVSVLLRLLRNAEIPPQRLLWAAVRS